MRLAWIGNGLAQSFNGSHFATVLKSRIVPGDKKNAKTQ
jgi:hypothetical protein